VAQIEACLPLTSGHRCGLGVFRKGGRLAQQESRELIPRPRGVLEDARRPWRGSSASVFLRLRALQSRGIPAESATALQSVGAELGLQVIEFQLDDVDAGSQFVLGEDLRNRAAEAVVELLAIERHPVWSRADGVTVLEGGQTAGPYVFRIVHAG